MQEKTLIWPLTIAIILYGIQIMSQSVTVCQYQTYTLTSDSLTWNILAFLTELNV